MHRIGIICCQIEFKLRNNSKGGVEISKGEYELYGLNKVRELEEGAKCIFKLTCLPLGCNTLPFLWYILEILKKLMYTNVCPEYFLYKWRINGGEEEGLGWGNSSSFDADFLINSS